jgi:hypothetical protein
MHDPDHGHPVLRLVIFDGVAADDRDAGLARDLRAAGEDAGKYFRPEFLHGVRGDVQSADRRSAHRIDVGERVRRRDAPEVIRIVDDRREEIDGLNDREVVAQPIDARIVAGRETDEDVGVDLSG